MPWQPLPYEAWRETRDTLHAHSQVLGKLAAALAPPEPELLHAALRVTARGWQTRALPAPDGSGSLVAALDLQTHEAVVEHSGGASRRIPLTPNRSVGDVTVAVLDAVAELAGRVEISMTPQETPWTTPLDEDVEHATYDPARVEEFHAAATSAALVLAEFRAPYRGRSSPVNAWWGSFDLGVFLFSGKPIAPPGEDFLSRNSMDAEQLSVGWWPGDHRYGKPAFYAYSFPAPEGIEHADASPGRYEPSLGEFVLDWDEAIATPDPAATVLAFFRRFARSACDLCAWDPALARSLEGEPPPLV
jgi:hypothetical protein